MHERPPARRRPTRRRPARRPALALAALALLAALAPVSARALSAADRPAGLVIVLNSGEATISLLDAATGEEVKRVPALREPHHLMLTPDGHDLLVGDTVGNEMLFLDPQSGEIRRRVPVTDPYQLGFSPDGRLLTVAGLARNQVDVYDAKSLALVKRFPAATMPSHIAYAPDGSVVYVTLQGTDNVAAYDLRRMAPLWVAKVGSTPAGIIWHQGKLLVADMGTDHVAVLDPTDGTVQRTIRTGRGAHQIFASPDGRLIYVNNRVEGTTVALDAATLDPVRTYRVKGGPDDIAFARDGRLWITLRFVQKVAVLDPATGALTTYPVGRSPHGIFLTQGLRP